jgi:hypothetical protein
MQEMSKSASMMMNYNHKTAASGDMGWGVKSCQIGFTSRHRKEKKWHIWTMNQNSTITPVTYIPSHTLNPILIRTLFEYLLTPTRQGIYIIYFHNCKFISMIDVAFPEYSL